MTLLSKVASAAVDAILLVNEGGCVVYANEGSETTFGWPAEELVGQPLDVLIPAGKRDAHPRLMAEFANGGAHSRSMSERCLVWGLHRSGREIPLSITIISEVHDGAPVFAAIARDVSEWIAKERDLRKSRTRLKVSQKIAAIGSWDWDIPNDELYWSEEVYELFGCSPAEFSASYEAFLQYVHPDDRNAVGGAVRRALEKGESYSIDHRIVRADGEVRHVHEEAVVRTDETDTPILMEGIVQDITGRKKMEEALIRARNEAQRASEAKTRFLAMMSHELRTPLNAVIGFSDMMINELFGPLGTESYHAYARDIARSGKHLLALVEDILDATRIGQDEIVPDERNFAVFPMLHEAVRLTDVYNACENSRICMDEGDPQLHLLADRRMCFQAVSNLCRNALKFSRADDAVTISVLRPDGDGGELVIEVLDRGVGIREDALPRVTDPFFRSSDNIVEENSHPGLGLGLYIVHRFMDAHGGRVEIENRSGRRGVSARVVFPAWRVNRGVATEAASAVDERRLAETLAQYNS